ncbi:MAG: hypothetical protein HY725_05615 [Candidatus Rokubacteria bacterium]|nr:hypothetical protein [Candidatus Rokubacteria bacterium]
MTAAPTRVLLADPQIAGRRETLGMLLGDEFLLTVPSDFGEAALTQAARDAEVIVAHAVPPAVLTAASRLRLFQLWIAGVDHLDFALLRRLRIRVAAAHENARTVAELALAHVLACGRGLALGDRKLRTGDWSVGRFKAAPGSVTYGTTVGIVGYGAIGRAFVELARGLAYRILAIKRHRDEHLAARDGLAFLGGPADLPRLLAESNFVMVTLPKTADTLGLFDEGKLKLMKPSAWLIVVGRMETVDEGALYRACRERWIAGAGIDVWTHTPPPEPRLPSRFPFHELDNVVMTPHCGGWSREAVGAQIDFVVENLRRFRRGEPLRALVDLELGY